MQTVLTFVCEGDELNVTNADRLARSIWDPQDTVRELDRKGVTLRAIDQPIDTLATAGRAFLDMLVVLAAFGTNLCGR